MTQQSIYKDIAERTGGEIYIGVVGPVRTGKSTFIKRFMETLVLPHMEDGFIKDRTNDELPQSASGKTVMTTEPKFIPNKALTLHLDDLTAFQVKMIDCVGYLVPGVLGHTEDDKPRMVMTPWSDVPIPFEKAAEIGTQKVINEHATIGVLVTSDGSFGELPREAYTAAEERCVAELKQQNKPFVIVLNTSDPSEQNSIELAKHLEEQYDVPVALVSCLDLDEKDIRHILEMVLLEFPIKELRFELPMWISVLESDHPFKKQLLETLSEKAEGISRVGEIKRTFDGLTENSFSSLVALAEIDLASGSALCQVSVPESTFYRIAGDYTGLDIDGEETLLDTLKQFSEMKSTYEKYAAAIQEVNQTGYGIVTPSLQDLTLEEPEIVKQPGGYGVKLRASAPSIHMTHDKHTCWIPKDAKKAQRVYAVLFIYLLMPDNIGG